MKRSLEIIVKNFWVVFVALVLWSVWASAQEAANPSTIQFTSSRYTVMENGQSAQIVLRRSGPTNNEVTVTLATTEGTAVVEIDYAPRSLVVSVPAGAVESVVRIPIHDNFRDDGNRTVRLALSQPSAGTTLGPLQTAELVIMDNDGQHAGWLTFGLDRVEWLQRSVAGIPLWQYAASLIYIFLAFYVARFTDHLLRGGLKRMAAKTATQFDDMLLNLLRGPIRLAAFVILMHFGLQIFSWPSWFEDVLSKCLKIVIACSLTWLALQLIDLLLGYWRRRATTAEDAPFNEQLLPIIRKTIKVFVVVVATLLTLQNLGLNITSLIASLSIGGLALSLAAQDTLSNLFGAVAVLADKPFKVGDRIQLDSIDGVVESIGLRSTRVRNLNGHLITIPNKTIGNAAITNVTSRPNIKTEINIGITYDTPAEKVQRAAQILSEVYRGHRMTQDVWISFNKFADSALNIFVVHWWKSTDYKEYLGGMQEMNLEVKKRFDAEEIGFAFPTRTLYVKQDSSWKLDGTVTSSSTADTKS
jgi:MscS family membrane protein